MQEVRAKKHLGQHFLKDKNIAERIVNSLLISEPTHVLEVGPGTGVLTDHLIQNPFIDLNAVEIDEESVSYLRKRYSNLSIIEGDFLSMNLMDLFNEEQFSVIGNFPYNISSQIFFKLLPLKDQVPMIVCMLQKEVAERLASPPGNKSYGILSVLLQAYYEIEYLFTVSEHVFTPPPKVKSAVIRLKRNQIMSLNCDEALFKTVVKLGFNQRRKTLRNALKQMIGTFPSSHPMLDKRAEQLNVADFIDLTNWITNNKKLMN
ncbi:16S rRNA (adenine(1518)-N(6)/adenine(1519)-N(6))-dimethyltransferase RsmA [Microbacter margulisiae]|uniref:Ribosomal RNA small subunit methyltransferase A n=1 Tax=Microbacter margulisiae TaxID=1350067 RepID=A0A7W5DPU8_9PORP|nr:16S rRNA (adenine(1518)-N(6)/adenine(1519)-N(6))-dimethyltransferase RsmA [Microbacter margulisiae]MBB3186585.1 16S rRNA (adenine1518-N6/adenine1519-N6)-dimethyltransferase [Microbacter margulisiae]